MRMGEKGELEESMSESGISADERGKGLAVKRGNFFCIFNLITH